jgi:dTDP-4-amino-4,6-dideoxygalactose transaminase
MGRDEGGRMKDENHGTSMRLRSSSLLSPFRFHFSCFPLVPLAEPYWNNGTYRSIKNCLLKGQVVKGAELGALQAALCETLNVPAVVLCASGSLALEMALRACGVGRGDDVLVPAFCCSAVVPPILAVGAVPVLADVGAELNLTPETVAASLTTATRAVIVPHLFGNPAEIEAVVDLARNRKIHVIDDAAQSLGATIHERPVGSFGDAGVVSFGKEKVCFGLGGGAVILPNTELAERVASVRLPAPARMTALHDLVSTLCQHRWRRWSQPLERLFSLGSRRAPGERPPPYRKESMANLNAAVAGSLITTLQENIAARRARTRVYRGLLGGDERVQLVAHRNGSACLTQVLRILPVARNQDQAARVIGALNNSGYEVQGSYIPIHLLPGFAECKRRRLNYTERVWEDLVELPCEPGVSLSHIERIAAIVKQTLGRED